RGRSWPRFSKRSREADDLTRVRCSYCLMVSINASIPCLLAWKASLLLEIVDSIWAMDNLLRLSSITLPPAFCRPGGVFQDLGSRILQTAYWPLRQISCANWLTRLWMPRSAQPNAVLGQQCGRLVGGLG